MPKAIRKSASGGSSRDKKQSKLVLQLAAATSAGVSANLKTPLELLMNSVTELNKTVAVLAKAQGKGKVKAAKITDASQDPSEEPSDMSAAADPSSSNPSADMSAAADELEDELTAARKSEDDASEDPSEEDDASEDDASVDAEGTEPSDYGSSDPSDSSSEPGDQNPHAMEKFKKHSREHLHAAAEQKFIDKLDAQADQIQELMASNKKMLKSLKKRDNTIRSLEAQVERFSEHVNRRSAPPELSMILAKGGTSVAELKASGEKVSVDRIDQLFKLAEKDGILLGPKERVGIKNLATEMGILEDGVVVR